MNIMIVVIGIGMLANGPIGILIGIGCFFTIYDNFKKSKTLYDFLTELDD